MTAPEKQKSHRDFAREQVTGAIGQICDAWNDAIAASAARGYPSGGQGGSGGIGGHGDPTGNRALVADAADGWIRRARGMLVWVLQFSARDDARTGRFDPVRLKPALKDGGAQLVDIWPARVMNALNQFYDLADEALREWPPTPEKGDVIDGVKVLDRTRTGEDCAKCGKYVAGDAGDPIRRLDGKPYHVRPCWETARKRKQRSDG